MREIRESLDAWVGQGKAVALATVVSTWGSSPRQPGARMGITSERGITGSVSGGCVEGAVVTEALECLARSTSKLLHFGVTDEQAWQVGLSCGGRLDVLVQPLDPGWWRAVSEQFNGDRAVASLAALEGPCLGDCLVAGSDGEVIWKSDRLEGTLLESFQLAARQALDRGSPETTTAAQTPVFIDCLMPRPRLILIGGAHVAIALQSLARTLGFRVILIDPRSVFATPERFPEVEAIYHEYPQEVLPQLGLDTDTYLAVLTHDPKIDDPALLESLPSPAPYVGVLSSRRTHRKRVARLRERGVPQELIDRVHTPIGLEIGARTPEEIALAIMAEIVSVRRKTRSQ